MEASYLASGAQTRAVLGGFAADVVLLAMSPDVEKLVNGGLVEKTWAQGDHRGIVTSSVVAFAVAVETAARPKPLADIRAAGRRALASMPTVAAIGPIGKVPTPDRIAERLAVPRPDEAA